MRVLGVISTTVLLVVLGSTIPAFAQEAGHEKEAKPAAQQEKQAKPAAQEKQAKPAAQEKQAKPAAQEKQARPAAQEKQAKPAAQEKQAKPAAQQEKQARPAAQQKPQTKQARQGGGGTPGGQKPPQRSAADEQRQRGVPALRLSVRGSGRIPDDRFHANFGEGHRFAISQPVMVGGYSRFQYGGYWFGFVEPWPVGWYYTDQVYVDYVGGGYYLFNPFYPGVRVEIAVVP
ncbi:MAG: hypothetical protein ABSD98_08885 [Candidatus Korobacteraceae bacterium]|jgi:hypothetical protein